MTESIRCPIHGERPAVPAVDPADAANGFTVCRSCWYREWMRAVLRPGAAR